MMRAAFVLAWLCIGCRTPADAVPALVAVRVHCAPVETRSWADVDAIRGTVAVPPEREAMVSAQVPGRLLRVAVREGDRVAAGDVIAEVEPRQAGNAVRQAEARLAEAQARRNVTREALERETRLFEQGIHARQSAEQAKAQSLEAAAAVASCTADLDMARQQVDRTLVRAPASGVVVRVLRHGGEVVDGTPAMPIVDIADPTVLEIAAGVPAALLVRMQPEQTADVTFSALPGRHFPGRVRTVSPGVDPMTGMGSVRLALETTATHPPLGLLGEVDVTTGQSRGVTVVPAAAVRNAGGTRSEIVVCNGNRAEVVQVVTGYRRDGLVAVQGALHAGQRVAIDELLGLAQGTPIEAAP